MKAHEPFKIEILLIQQKDCEPLFKALWESDISAQQVAAFVHGHFGIDYVLINAYAKRYNTKSPPDTLYYTTEFVGVPYILEQNYQNTVPSKPKTKSSDQSRFMHFCTYCISNYNMNIKLSKVCGLLSIASYFALGATTIALTFSAIGMVALANAIYIRKSKDTSLYNNL